MNRKGFYMLVFILLVGNISTALALPRCLHVMSYHQGYAWNDGIEAGVEKGLARKCELQKFYMDSKRNTSPEFIHKKALEAKKLIEEFKPDIMIVSDDNASRYLVQPYFKNASLPIVFNGVNWTAEVYGYPYKNVTGMVEVAPIEEMLNIARRNTSHIYKFVFISDDVVTEHKDFRHYKRVYEKLGLSVKGVFVKTIAAWEKAFVEAQSADFIILGNNAGINDWDKQRAAKFVAEHGKRLTMTTYTWMMPYVMLGVGKRASEQGEWAAEVALAVLSGTNIADIPITVNRYWTYYQNKMLLKKAYIDIDKISRHKALAKDWLNVKN